MIKTWRIAECGWDVYFAEVVALSRGRRDVKIECWQAGVISLVQVCRQGRAADRRLDVLSGFGYS